jgi:hypothetical protein
VMLRGFTTVNYWVDDVEAGRELVRAGP